MKKSENKLPSEVVKLVKTAMESDITKENFKQFLKEEKEKRENNSENAAKSYIKAKMNYGYRHI